MRHHRYLRSILLLPVVLAGCSTTIGSRFGGNSQFGGTPQSKSIAVVGDRPQPATTGEPGGKVAAEDPEPEPRLNPKARISGRVVDDQGEPVPNVTVRLADGGAKGGKDIRAKTDRSGAFTLNGLRPGSTYSLIAETEDNNGPLIGRVQARTAETGVEIALASEGADASATTRRSARPSRAKPISNLEEREPSPVEDAGPTLNREDIQPPAEDANTLDPGPPLPRTSRPQLSAPESSAGWKNSKTTAARPRTQDDEIVASAPNKSPRKRPPATVDDPVPDADDEGPNPLPPAIDTGGDPDSTRPATSRGTARNKVGAKVAPRSSEAGEIALAPEASVKEKQDRVKVFAKGEPETSVAANVQPISRLEPDLESASVGGPPSVAIASSGPAPVNESPPVLASPPAMPALTPDPVALLESPPPPGSLTVPQVVAPSNPAPRPVFASQPQPVKPAPTPEPSADYNPFAIAAATPPVVERPAPVPAPAAPPPTPAPPASSLVPDEVAQTAAEAPLPVPKKKWGELAATDRQPVVVEPTRATAASPASLIKRLRGTPETRDPSIALCTYDPRLRKLTDFRLPDLEGKPVQFKDLDADYVLLDFWGTWCPPCLEAIPHLISLQKKYGPGRLRVVGIACEDGPLEQRKAKVDEVSRKLGINYAVLLSALDGKPCPVQQAFQIQSFPTLILVDRRGNIVWRSTGTTPATENRLDRVLASQMSRSETVRR